MQELRVVLKEYRGSQTLLCALGAELWVREGDPNLIDLAIGKERCDKLDAGTKEAYIAHLALGCGLCSSPDAGTLDIHADKVLVGIALGEGYRIFALTATEFENYRVVVVEEIFAIITLQWVVGAEHLLECRLYKALESQILCKFAKFIFSHLYLSSIPIASTPCTLLKGSNENV